MRKIITTTFLTLDGVMQGPGGPKEDTSGGFKQGGWQFRYSDKMTEKMLGSYMKQPFELLLGRFTYDIFASYWPHTKDAAEIAKKFNSTKKYVVSHKAFEPEWKNTSCVSKDVVARIKKLKKEKGPDLWVWGSGNLIQTLLKHNLIDVMNIWIYPLTLGRGKRLFAEGMQASGFELVETKISQAGIILATYEPAGVLKS